MSLGRYRDLKSTVQRRYLYLSAQRRRGERYGNLAEQIVAVAGKNLMRLDLKLNIEIAGRSAVEAGLALT